MNIILNINTAESAAELSIARDGKILESVINLQQKDHASFIQPAISELLQKCGLNIKELKAVAVSNGPGSYTGLRVGLATAKGLCYALNIPLITLNTLSVMAHTSIMIDQPETNDTLYCPMIDARRNEVFTAVYDRFLNIQLAPTPLILSENCLEKFDQTHRMVFSGSGSAKWKPLSTRKTSVFVNPEDHLESMASMSFNSFTINNFTDLAYSEPFYFKEFFYPQKT
ncbi:MAG TPA: tRNA (adenosine(37)-N6)-threonylcarbamoyltransferase complex dimerization subunit type 1 TsaB [Parasegetibacter sp.]